MLLVKILLSSTIISYIIYHMGMAYFKLNDRRYIERLEQDAVDHSPDER